MSGPRDCPDCGALTEIRTDAAESIFSDDGEEICPECGWSPAVM
jgi:predicted RNA-binding Zn-ribbon protein involved in translation (DUF1610 family)